MSIITQVKFNKRQDIAKVYIDGEYFADMVDECVVRFGIKEGAVVDEKSLNTAVFDSQIRQAFNWLMIYLADYPSSKNRCLTKLIAKGYSQTIAELAIDKAQEYKYIDDEGLCRALADSYIQKYSLRQTKDKLIAAQFPLSIIREALSDIDVDSQEDTAYSKAVSWARYKDVDDIKFREKFMRYMSSKGYDFGLANKVYKRIKEELNE